MTSFETMTRAARIDDDEWKKDLLLHFAGQTVQQLFDTLPELPDNTLRGPLVNVERYTPNMTCYGEAKAKLDAFFLPKGNATYERHVLRQMKQNTGESIDAFTVRLRIQAERCDFEDKVEENIKDQVIQSCLSSAMRRGLLKRGDASLEEILKIAKIYETLQLQEKLYTAGPEQKVVSNNVNKIDEKPQRARNPRAELNFRSDCNRCGYSGHAANDKKCPARGKTCNKCGGNDHFARKCRKRSQSQSTSDNRPKSNGQGKPDSDKDKSTVKNIIDGEVEYVFNVTSVNDSGEICGEIGGVVASMVIDSGSRYNLLSESTWEQLKKQKVVVSNQRKEVDKVFKAYGGHVLPLLGAVTVVLKLGTKCEMVDFYVVKGNGKTLIGRETAVKMEVLKIGTVINQVSSDPSGPLGTIKDVVVDIPIKADVTPVVQPYRRIPVALEKVVDKKIDELLEMGVIEKVNKPTKWISPMVVVPKGDDVRICLDMRRANTAIERENHPLPTFDDFLPHLGKAKAFSRLDVKNAFHQVG